ncbi:hypothetical protein OPIT5_08045 [Opitutaceae bacterium TAV5]|nr:hypothetical protein OPIT5_08045 [Opitutaceae bacterium TAV5]
MALLLAGTSTLTLATSAAAANQYTPAADSGIRSDSPGINYGTDENIQVRGHTNFRRDFYVRFDISDLTSLSGVTVSDASFSITLSGNQSTRDSGNAAINVYALNADYTATVEQLGFDWGETDLTYNNAPDISAAALVGTFDISGLLASRGTTYTITGTALTSFLNDYLAAGGSSNLTFIIRENASGAGGYLQFASKENVTYDAPSLSITHGVIPEPSTCAALAGALALAGVIALRLRR